MRKFPVCIGLFIALFPAVGVQAQTNLIRNGSFDRKDLSEYYLRASRDYKDHKLLDSHGGVFIEELPGNPCYRIDLDRYVADKDGRKGLYPVFAIGGATGYDLQDGRKAMAVEPDTTYAFSVEIRGTVNKVGFSAVLYHGKDVGYNSFTRVKTSIGGGTVGEEWTTYKGTFKTAANTNRAVLRLSIYTNERWGLTEKPGTYLLIDNISIHKQSSPLAALDKPVVPPSAAAAAPRVAAAPMSETPQVDGKLDDPAWQAGPWQSGFRLLSRGIPAETSTKFKLIAAEEALYVAAVCDEPTPRAMRLKAAENGQSVYTDDCIELFVDNGRAELPVRQYLISADAVCQMLWVGSSRSAVAADYDAWSAATGRTDKGWTVEVKIPWRTLGLDGRPQAGRSVGFNLCRDRYAGDKPEHSSWSFSRGNFRDPAHFGRMVIGTLADNMNQRVADAQAALAAGEKLGGKAAVWTDLKNRLASVKKGIDRGMTATQWAEAYSKLKVIRKAIDVAPLGTQPFVITRVSSTAKFTIPFIPRELSAKPQPIRLHASINEFESLPIAITNLTDRTESYRVVLYSALKREIPVAGLIGKDGRDFPADQIHQFEAIRVKNDDSPNPGQHFDPLAPMGVARTLTVPPRESGIAWFTFDCRNIAPGTYTGTLRVIPLSAPGKYVSKNGWHFDGAMQESPLSLEVWPITLPQASAIPLWLMDGAPNIAFFKDMIEHGNRLFQINPWSFDCEFDGQGNLVRGSAPSVGKAIQNWRDWAKQMKLEPPPRVIIAFSTYRVANQRWFSKMKFEIDSPQWRKALTQYLQFIEKTLSEAGLPPGSYDVELWDEPHTADQAEVMATLRVARQACPKMRINMTLGAGIQQQPAQIAEMAQYADSLCFWTNYWSHPEYLKLMRTLRSQGKEIWLYACDTNPRIDLYRYYRLHAWDGWTRDVAALGLFDYVNGPGGLYGAASWKETPYGALVYNAGGQPVDSIRFEALREGLEDIKYLAVLKQALVNAPADSPAAKAAAEFLKTVPAKIVGPLSHDTTQADQARAKAAELILQLQGKTPDVR